MNEALRQLAERAGVGLGYHDVFGHYHATPEPVLRALLVSLGLLSAPDADPEAALAQWEDALWRQVLPPVRVIREDEPAPGVRLTLPAELAERQLRWILRTEEGERAEASFDFSQGEPLGERTLGGITYRATELGISHGLPLGYHRLEVWQGERKLGCARIIVTPEDCFQPDALKAGGRVWGPAVQLYSVRSERNWGMGDFTDLKRLAEQWAERGADIVGLNPLHALFLGNPAHASPYSPTSRRFINALYLDVEAIPDFAECAAARELVRSGEFQLRLRTLREAPLVDYPGVAAAKLTVLERLFQYFQERHLAADSPRARAFRAYCEAGGEPLRRYALFEALYAWMRRRDPNAWGATQWPEAYQDPTGSDVRAFAEVHAERIAFFQYLQWQAHLQLGQVAARLRELGVTVGLYLDLAVSADRGGADAWQDRAVYAPGVNVGAPPDEFNRQGQDWGLPPFHPQRLREAAYEPFIATVRENMRRAGALRIDHVMGLFRLYWVPWGRSAADGAYVHYPFQDLLGIVALESHRNRCLVIGEDLGTVPEEVRRGMAEYGILSYRLLYFEKGEGNTFKPLAQFPADALAAVSTHDLPTLAGYWEGHDLTLRTELGLFPSEQARTAQVLSRGQDRAGLLLALEREGLLPEGASVEPVSVPVMTEAFARAVHVYLARSPAKVLMVQPEDVLLAVDQVNLPGSVDEHPNWRRKLTVSLERWPDHEPFLRLAQALADTRPHAPRPVAPPRAGAVIPRATYRLQLNAGFTIADATALIPYLAALGVSHVYCSPYLRARPGSSHGYDIIDHNAYNPEIGSPEDFARFFAALREHGMGQVLDIVPNHMGVMGEDNQWWLDVLENGPAALHADTFDIDWHPAKRELRDKVLLPTLGGPYGEVLERGELKLEFDPALGAYSVRYFNHRFPIAPDSYPELLGHGLDALALRLGEESTPLMELRSLISAFGGLPGRGEASAEARLERHRELTFAKQRLSRLSQETSEIREYLEEGVREFSGRPEAPESFDKLHALLEAQSYRLAHWHAAADEINYRRFFDIHDLAALRMEDPGVFEATHQLILGLLAARELDGLRVDHPDGLYDPQAYFERLQSRAGAASEEGKPLYLLVEKILASNEALPPAWPVHGTTGYDFMNLVNGLFVDPRGERHLRRFYAAYTGEPLDFDLLVYKCKRLIMKYALASELNVLANELNRMSEQDRHTRDFTLNRLRVALAEFVAWLPVYRTYERDGAISEADRRYIHQALARAREGSRAEELSVYDFLRGVLLREGLRSESMRRRAGRFAMRLQQYTGAVMAKGMEDTAFYRYFPLISLNEVGGDPRVFGVSVEDFHRANAARSREWPHALSATATHDNKRGEDARVRIDVLSELESGWRAAVRRWSALAQPLKPSVDGRPAPSRNDEYLLYQTLVGAWPFGADAADEAFRERIQAYLLKALREAKQHTSWINPNAGYEEAVAGFVQALLTHAGFLADFLPFQRRIAHFGALNSLSQTLIKLTAPGVPDLYQGTELWDLALVDPDNRRPVDYGLRRRLLETLPAARPAAEVHALAERHEDGRAKLYLIRHALMLRRQHETLFRDGEYTPLASSGSKAEHLCAFARGRDRWVLVIVPRLCARLLGEEGRLPLGEEVWGDTRIDMPASVSGQRFINALTGEEITVQSQAGGRFIAAREALASFPVALLLQER